MFSVLIVEDEILVSIGLKNMIDWESMDMRVVAEAQDGRTALELYEKLKPDLILTDIKMPVMDGLELITQIRKNDKKTKIIILSCYQEFDFLHQAMKLGVTDYILKLRMSTEEMQSVVKKAHDELVKENRELVDEKGMHVDIRLARENSIREYLVYRTCTGQEFEGKVKKLKMNLNETGLVVCVMQIDRYGTGQDPRDARYEASIRDIIGNLVCGLLEKSKRGEIVHETENRYILLFSFGDLISEHNAQSLLFEILGRINQIMVNYIDSTVTFGISSRSDHYSRLVPMVDEALAALRGSYYLKDRRYFRYGDEECRNLYDQLMEQFRTSLKENSTLDGNYRAEILSGLELLRQMYGKPEEAVRELFAKWIYWPAAYLNTNRSGKLSLALEYANRVGACSFLADAIQVFEQYMGLIVRNQSNSARISREVAEAAKYIRDNYNRDISLQQVADHVEMSANYLSSLFKKELQSSFIDYLNKVRMDKAGELLLTTHLKSYEVAQRVGFADESYFSRIFKKIKGVRPNEFKKLSVEGMDGIPEENHGE